MGPRGGAESIELACSPAGHLFVSLIKGKWLLLSSSCSLSTGEPVLYSRHGSADSFPPRGCSNQQGWRRGSRCIPCSCFTALGQDVHTRTHPETHPPAPEEGAQGGCQWASGICSARVMSRTCLISYKVNGDGFLVPLVRCRTACATFQGRYSLGTPKMKGDTMVGTYCGDGAMPLHPLLGSGAAQGLICPKLASGGLF